MFHEGGNEVRQEIFRLSGAAVMGRRMFDLGVDPWGDDPPFFTCPCTLLPTAAESLFAGLGERHGWRQYHSGGHRVRRCAPDIPDEGGSLNTVVDRLACS